MQSGAYVGQHHVAPSAHQLDCAIVHPGDPLISFYNPHLDERLGPSKIETVLPARECKFAPSARAELSVFQCRARKVKCTAQPPEDCRYCIAQQQPCRWPVIDGRKCRAKRVKRGPGAAPTVNAGGIDWTDSVVASQAQVAANQMTTWVPQPVGTEEDVQAFLNSILNGDILQRDEQDCDNRTGPSTRSQVRWWRPHGRTAFEPGG